MAIGLDRILLILFKFYIVFFLVSGLKINLNKSNLYGVCTNWGEVEDFALVVGCRPYKLPFNYIGLHVGQNMTRIVGWKCIIDRFEKKIIQVEGGKSMLLKSVLGSLSTYFFLYFSYAYFSC